MPAFTVPEDERRTASGKTRIDCIIIVLHAILPQSSFPSPRNARLKMPRTTTPLIINWRETVRLNHVNFLSARAQCAQNVYARYYRCAVARVRRNAASPRCALRGAAAAARGAVVKSAGAAWYE